MNNTSAQPKFSTEYATKLKARLATGQITLAEYVGLGKEQQYEIARIGYQLLNSGKLEEAREIYAGLVAADPFDSVFHGHLGAVYHRMGELKKAFAAYDDALRYNFANTDALTGRGEIYILQGEPKKGLEDLRKALESDPNGKKPSTARARALLLSLHEAAEKQSAALTALN